MANSIHNKFILMFAFIFVFSMKMKAQTTVGLIEKSTGSLDYGYVLFPPLNSLSTYLIDKCGNQQKVWTSKYKPGQSAYILNDGTLLRPGKVNNTTFTAGGNGGIIEKIDANNNVIWSYLISDANKCQHHDVKILPNGNVLAIVWELKTKAEAVAQGRNSSLTATTIWSEAIYEVQPVGTSGGNIVWEWHAWDHLIQDFDNTKANFGTISTNPQLINANYNALLNTEDWLHLNSVDYNAELDQIVLSSHGFSEFWIIDHSTTLLEAKTHIGGNSGKGGDIIYRWGNPAAYSNGTVADRKFWGQHNVHWIEKGLPNADQIMIFNNGNGRTGGSYSTVEIVKTPVVNYNYTSTLPYLPTASSWIYNAGNPNSFYATNISGAQQLSNGNVLICNGPSGIFTEVTSLGASVWKYISPVASTSIIEQGNAATQNLVFRAEFYPINHSGIKTLTLSKGKTIENTNSVTDLCNSVTGITDINSVINFDLYPNPTEGFVNLSSIAESVTVIDIFGTEIIYAINTNTIDLSNQTVGIYVLKILKNGKMNVVRVMKK